MPEEPSILHIPIKREFFDAILAGTKKEEYRDFSPFWISRLATVNERGEVDGFREYDIVRFRNGYNPDSPVMDVEFIETIIQKNTSAPRRSKSRYIFAILLGKVLATQHL